MTTMTEKTTRVAEAQRKLIDQFKAHTNIDALVKAFALESQEVEEVGFDIIENTLVSTAAGLQLDNLGTVVGVEREGRTDGSYRVRIGAQISLNVTSGTIPELIDLAVALGAAAFDLTEIFPAKINVDITAEISNGAEIATVLGRAKPAGVGIGVTWYESATAPFLFDTALQGFDLGELGEMIFT